MLDPDSFYQNGHEVMKEKLITSSLVMKDKGFIAKSNDIAFPSSTLKVRLDRLDSPHTHNRNSLLTGSDQGVNSESPCVSVERDKRNPDRTSTKDT